MARGKGKTLSTLSYTPSGSSLDQYLVEIERFPLLGEQEYEVARRSRQGDPEAYEKLVTSNLRFVISIVKRYQNRGIELTDLIGVGNRGLMKAAQKFDETKGVKFISYAVWWIRQYVLTELAHQSRPVRIPTNQMTVIYRAQRLAERYIAEGINTAQAYDSAIQEVLGDQVTPEQRHVILTAKEAANPLRLNRTVKYDEHGLDERFAHPGDENGASTTRAAEESNGTAAINAALASLPERDEQILRFYYGLHPEETEELTLEEIGARLGVTRERIRQLRDRALERLRRTQGGLESLLS